MITCKAVADVKATHDIVIVARHWGIEYQDYFDPDVQQTPAQQLVDAGADVVLGNHPHVIQGIEFYNNALITYSQGDFVFDHYSLETGQTLNISTPPARMPGTVLGTTTLRNVRKEFAPRLFEELTGNCRVAPSGATTTPS